MKVSEFIVACIEGGDFSISLEEFKNRMGFSELRFARIFEENDLFSPNELEMLSNVLGSSVVYWENMQNNSIRRGNVASTSL